MYAELHAWSNFTFLEGGSHPEELVDRAADLGLAAIALTDRDGLYGMVRFAAPGAASAASRRSSAASSPLKTARASCCWSKTRAATPTSAS